MVGMRKKITLTDVKLPGQPPYSYTKDEQLEFMLNLQVPSHTRAVTVATLLQLFCSVEAVDKGLTVDETDRKRLKEQYGRCRKREPATQQLQITSLPALLFLNPLDYVWCAAESDVSRRVCLSVCLCLSFCLSACAFLCVY